MKHPKKSAISPPFVGLVPARGGSKGVPDKNLRPVAGHPLLAWSIRAGLDSGALSRTYVTSDSEDILAVAEEYGAHPILRPQEYATDEADLDGALGHAIGEIRRCSETSDFCIVLLQPTSPLRGCHHVKAACDLFTESYTGPTGHTTGVISVYEPRKTPFKAFRINADGYLEGGYSLNAPFERRQDLPQAVFPNGAMYLFPASLFERSGGIPRTGMLPFMMDEDLSVDIDTMADFAVAERILEARR